MITKEQHSILYSQLQQIADTLLLTGTLIECPGLVHGKTGIALFFFHYARFTGNELFEEYGMDLLGAVQSQLKLSTPADYEDGIAGIGTSLHYLIRNGYIDASDDFFDDFDRRMYRAVVSEPCPDYTLYRGLTGYGRYWIARMSDGNAANRSQEIALRILDSIEQKLAETNESDNEEMEDMYCYLYDLNQTGVCDVRVKKLLDQCPVLLQQDTGPAFSRLGQSAEGELIRRYLNNHYVGLSYEVDIDLNTLSGSFPEKTIHQMGLLNGRSGQGLCRLTGLDPNIASWMRLL